MKKHPMAGSPVKVTKGAFKDRYFIVIDWFQNMFQGKSMEKLKKSQAGLLNPVKRRGYELDNKVVFGRLYPSRDFMCMHDDEIQVAPGAKAEKLPPAVVEESKENVVNLAEKRKNGTKKASRRNSKDTKPGESDKH